MYGRAGQPSQPKLKFTTLGAQCQSRRLNTHILRRVNRQRPAKQAFAFSGGFLGFSQQVGKLRSVGEPLRRPSTHHHTRRPFGKDALLLAKRRPQIAAVRLSAFLRLSKIARAL
jgi:hypothetical protein